MCKTSNQPAPQPTVFLDKDGQRLYIVYLTMDEIKHDYVNNHLDQLSHEAIEQKCDGFIIKVVD